MSDEKLAPVLSSWLKSRDIASPDATRSAAQVMARVSQTRQRGRWWPLPILGRATVTPAAIRGTGSPLAPIPARNGQTSSVTGRTQFMFSPVKAALIGALVFALGGVWFIAQPFDQPGATVPAAATAEPASSPGEWTAVTGTSSCGLGQAGVSQMDTPPYSLTNQILRCFDAGTDPRVSGLSTVVLNLSGWDEGLLRQDPANSVSWLDYTIQGPDGAWAGHGYGLYDDAGVFHGVSILAGSGAYAGLTFTLAGTVPAGSSTSAYSGLIQPGSLPPGFPVMPFPEATPASE